MPIGAGQLLLVGGHDLSADATSVDLPKRTDIREVTGVKHRKRQRKAVGLDDGAFSLTAYFEDSTDKVFASGQTPRITRVFGDAAGATCNTYARAITDTNLSVTHPVGEFYLSSYAGNINGGIGRGHLLARIDGSYSAGNTNLYTAQYADLGARGTRTATAVVHVYEAEGDNIATARLSVYASASRNTWASAGNALDIALVSGAGADWIAVPNGHVFGTSPQRVYRGAYATTSAATTALGTPHAVDVVYITGADEWRHWNGAWNAYTPPGLLAGSPFANEAAANGAVSANGQIAVWGDTPHYSTHFGAFTRDPGNYESQAHTGTVNRYVGASDRQQHARRYESIAASGGCLSHSLGGPIMAKSTTGLGVSITRVPSTVTGVTVPVNLVTGAEELNLGEFKKMTTIVESTGVGVDKRKRLDQGLQDLSSMTISALYDATAADDFTRVFNAIMDSHEAFQMTITWESGKNVAADWLVEDVAIPTDVGAFTKTGATLQSAGTWTLTL